MIIIDSNEPPWMKNHDWGVRTQVNRLPAGDIIIGKGILVERKEINDFLSSMEQRLWEQAHDLEQEVANEDNSIHTSIILIHGSVSDLNHRNQNARKISGMYGAIARLLASYDVSVLWVRGRSNLFEIVGKLHDKSGTDATKVKPHLTKRRYRDDRVNVLYGLDGVGYETAKNILEEFETVREVANASQDDLTSANGVGPKTASKIYSAFNEVP